MMMIMMMTLLEFVGWVLSFRDEPKLNGLIFKPTAETSTLLRTVIGAIVKTGVGEDAIDADATAFCTTVVSTKSKLLAAT